MRPLIITLTKDDEVRISLKDFRQYLNEAYDAGYSDGTKASNFYQYPYRTDFNWLNGYKNGEVYFTNTVECSTDGGKTNENGVS